MEMIKHTYAKDVLDASACDNCGNLVHRPLREIHESVCPGRPAVTLAPDPLPEVSLVMTCPACPEQYDAYVAHKKVGYLRLRHGHFTVKMPGVRGDLVYEASPEGDGTFMDDEREGYLLAARHAIANRLTRR